MSGFEDLPKSEHEEEKREIDPLLEATIYSEEAKTERAERFDEVWRERWQKKGVKDGYFQTEDSESPFAEYSSRGWKLHLAFTKGEEENLARILYENGLYFKVEAGSGTYFNGLKESGATVYIGSHDNMEEIAKLIEQNAGELLQDGMTAKIGERIVRVGSGSDVEILPRITGRFDTAKTERGWLEGNKKYGEYGLPSWSGLGGLPILSKHGKEVSDILDKWNKFNQYQRDLYYERRLKPIYEESKAELEKDFGSEFLFGKKVE